MESFPVVYSRRKINVLFSERASEMEDTAVYRLTALIANNRPNARKKRLLFR